MFTRRSLLTAASTGAAAASLPGSATAAPASSESRAVESRAANYARALDFCVERIRALAPEVTGYPERTEFEKWVYNDDGGWVGGFWPGQLWLAHLHSGDAELGRHARRSASGLERRATDTSTHDLGFLFYPSWVTAWRITGERAWLDGALRAADTLTRRYNERGRFLRAWGELDDPHRAGWVIVDTMMNLDLLLLAAEVTGQRRYAEIATAHADTTARQLVREDGSTCHVFEFDPESGRPLRQRTAQGYSATSCWARGQSWAVYGFTTVFRRTGQRRFLDVARRVADHLVRSLPPEHVPVWDYRSPYAPYDVRDSSAGAVAACGLLDLATVTGHGRYRATAERMLAALESSCSTRESDRAEGVLGRGTSNRPAERGIEVSLPYGDYYYAEALTRLVHPEEARDYLGTA
ncbi:glycoside hydrolase family 88 protein [Actinopolyspora sp. H202]|uniref:glycoside hydrolase family 88 protein n=1 Tax=Actinopolyspora sp. H202 TaxID=1500456 RepID=UPI003EE7949E